MRETTVSRSYAEAMFDLAEKHNAHDEFAAGLNMLSQILDTDATVRGFLQTPKIEVKRKQEVLRAALGGKVSPLFLNFVMIVLQKRRQRLLREIARAYADLIDVKMGRVHAQVTLAHEPDAATTAQIGSELTRVMGKTVIPHVQVNPDILGGIIVRYGDRIMDGSLRRRLVSLRHAMMDSAIAGQG